ncbi:hypothetical protein DW886_17515 [Enterocloster aldenensis]|uniref:hypothetical protein n=1 Tax=Enterocloster aldenensis TaxID=358742 RepID=UPI000E48B2E1|nr:hypothetical protein DW886_17515 [Enterocloster aldenensis]
MNEKHMIDKKVLINYLMEHYQYPWKFHDMITGISELPTESKRPEWIPVYCKLPDTEGIYDCVIFDCKTEHSFEDELYFNSSIFVAEEGCHVIVWKNKRRN